MNNLYKMPLKELFDSKKLKNDGTYSDSEVSQVEQALSRTKMDDKESMIVGLNKELTGSYVHGLSEWIRGEVQQRNLNSIADPNKKHLVDFLLKKITVFGNCKDDISKITNPSKKNVAIVQAVLLFLGYNRGNLRITGNFDEATLMALTQYQTFSNTYNYENNSNGKGKVNFLITTDVLQSLAKDLGDYQKAIDRGPNNGFTQDKISATVPSSTSQAVGPIDIAPEGETKTITMTTSQLSNEVVKKLKESGNKEFVDKLDKVLYKKGAAYQMLWSLLQNDASIYGSDKYYEGVSGWFRERSRAIDTAPIYSGDKVKEIIGKKQQKYQYALKKIQEAMFKGDFTLAEQGFDYLDESVFTLTNEEIASMITNYESNLGTEEYPGGFYIKKGDIERYRQRFDKGDIAAVFEFFSEVMKNQDYSNMMVIANCKDTVDTLDFLKENMVNLQNPNIVNKFMAGKKLILWGKNFNYPTNIDYHEIIEKYRKQAKGNPNLDELTAIIKLEVFKQQKQEILSSFDPKSNEYKILKNFYNDKSFWTDFERNGTSYIIKGLPLVVIGVILGGAVGIGAAALAGAMGIESTLGALGIGLASQIAITTPAMAMIGGTLAGESFQENLSRLGNFDMWKESALYNTILTLVSPVVGALKQSILIGKLGKGAASMKGANFVLKSFNLAKFAGDVGLTVAMDTLIFDGEFTPQELVNATIFALVNRASNIRRVVKNGEKIDFESMGKALGKSKSDIGDKPRQRTRPIEVPENYRILELENLTLEKIKSNTDSQNVKIVKRVELLKRDLELLKREIDLSGNKDKIPEYEYKQNLLSKTEKLLEKSLGVDDFSYIKEQNILNSLDPVTRQNIETLNMLAKDIDSIFCKDLKQKDADTHSQMGETMKKYGDKLEMFKNMMGDRYNELLHLLQKPVSETDMRKFEEKIIPLKQEINDLTARGVVPTDPKLARRQEELNRELYLLRNKYGEKRVAEFLQSLNQRLDKQFKAEKQGTNEKSKENIGYRILELENLTVEQIKLNTDAQNMKIVERLDLLKQDIKSLEKQVKSGDKSKQMELLYKKSLAARTESLIKETFGEENINYIKMKNKLNSLGKTVKDDLNYLNALTLTMDRLLFEHLHTVFEKGDNLDNSYIFGENGMSNKLYIYNKKLENFKKTLGSDFNEVSQFLLNPIYGKDIKLLEKDIPALKQTINILNMLKTPANNPQMVAKQRELNNHIDNLKRSYGSKRVEDLMHLIDQRVYKTNTRASGQQSQEQGFGNSYRAKVERPKEAQKTQAQTERERVDRISRLSLQKIKDDMLILKRDIEKIYGSDKSRGDIEVEINECKTTLQQAEKAFNENNFSKGTRFFELGTKRIEDLQKSLTNVYDKVQDYFVYTARLKEIGLSNDLKDLTLDNNSVNPARFKQFMNEVSGLKDKTQQIQKLADKAGNVKSGENRIYAGY